MLENARNAWKRTSSQWHARKTRSSELIKSYAHPSTALAFFSPTVWNARKNWITHLNSSPTSFPHQISTCELCTRKITHNNFSGKQRQFSYSCSGGIFISISLLLSRSILLLVRTRFYLHKKVDVSIALRSIGTSFHARHPPIQLLLFSTSSARRLCVAISLRPLALSHLRTRRTIPLIQFHRVLDPPRQLITVVTL